MATPDVLIHLRRTDEPTPAVHVGLALAKRLRAWTSGLHVVAIAPAAFASPEAVALQVHEADEMVDEAKVREHWWLAQLEALGLEGEWLVSQGDTVEVICHAARWSDLVVVVPDSVKHECTGARIVVAWNASREAIRAIRGAMPLLARAERVLVLEGEPVENPFGLRYLPKLDLRAWLARHDVNAEFRAFKPAAKERGAALLETARAESADLIVMGAWGHSRITELVLGGTTRYLFQSSDLPLLVAH